MIQMSDRFIEAVAALLYNLIYEQEGEKAGRQRNRAMTRRTERHFSRLQSLCSE